VGKSNATSRSTRLRKEEKDREEEEKIPCSRSEDEYTETPRHSSKSSYRLLVSLYPVARVPC